MKNRHILETLAVLKPQECIHERFTFSKYNTGNINPEHKIPRCGTAGCLLGELPDITQDWCFNEDGELFCASINTSKYMTVTEQASEYFDIDRRYIKALFIPSGQLEEFNEEIASALIKGVKNLSGEATLREVQKNLKLFLNQYN